MRLWDFPLMLIGLMIASCATDSQLMMLRPVPDAEAVGVYHVVTEGDTLFSICKTFRSNCQEVAEVNGIENANHIRVGQRIFIPDAAEPSHRAVVSWRDDDQQTIQHWKGTFFWPVKGVLTSRFGIRDGRRHDGIDISAPEGTEIRAAADGKVLYAGDQQTGYGNLIILRHAQDQITIYAHNQVNLVRAGQQVRQGETIGRVGKTGRASGPHLHFEIRNRTKPRNPLFFLPKPL